MAASTHTATTSNERAIFDCDEFERLDFSIAGLLHQRRSWARRSSIGPLLRPKRPENQNHNTMISRSQGLVRRSASNCTASLTVSPTSAAGHVWTAPAVQEE